MRVELEALSCDIKATMIFVTHDQVGAVAMADKYVVLNAGRIEQVGSPMDLYHQPNSEFVAGFIGATAMNFIDVTVSDGQAAVAGHGLAAAPAAAVRIGIGPEHMTLLSAGQGAWTATLTLRETSGGDACLYVLAAGNALVGRADGDATLDHGAEVGLDLSAHRLHFFDSEGRAQRNV